MLIYNHKKEFVGIDTHDLDALGYSDLNKLLNECSDFAQLFVKTPGFIHDFKHVHWIDFITCAQSNEDAKAIIHANGKSYRAILQIEKFYLLSDGNKVGYEVRLQNLRELTKDETKRVSEDILQMPPKASVAPRIEEVTEEPILQTAPISMQEENYEEIYSSVIEEDPYDIDTNLDLEVEEETLQVDDDFKLDLDDIHQESYEESEPMATEVAPSQKEEKVSPPEDDSFENNYVFDPHVASQELGLPLDLIEEFIQDFINQAYEFKEELYQSLDKGEIENVRILSHKLKGVAANLRIEDAFDVLVIVNTSDDLNTVALNLNRFYKIIAKLSGKEIPADLQNNEETAQEDMALEFKEEELQNEGDLYLDAEEEPLSFEEDIFDIDDSHVPEKIEIAELADDDFIEAPEMQEEPDLLEIEDEPVFKMQEEQTIQEIASAQEYTSSYKKSTVAGELGLDRESFDFLFKDFIEDTSGLLEELQVSLQASDLIQIKKIAMKIKGMSDNMRINDFKKELEELITTQDLESMKNSIEIIKMKLDALTKIED